MNMSHDMCYKVIKSQDARFDGIFFTAVKTTGIYCRPICRVSAPKSENCAFYDSAVEAEINGFRPCLRCRPELAPGYAEFEQNTGLMSMIIQYFEEQNYRPGTIKSSAEYFGISTRHVTRLFQQAMGVSPQSFIMTKRLLMAKGLLTDTTLPIAEIALIVGFGSISRFNDAFKKNYNLAPTSLRKENSRKVEKDDAIKVKLAYRPPYNWPLMISFYKMRTIPGVESVTDAGIYRRSLQIKQDNQVYSGWLEIKPEPENHRVIATISKSLEKVLMVVVKRIRVAFDLDAMINLQNPELPEGIRLPGCFDAFEMSTRAILGQQITVKAARTLTKRMVNLLGSSAMSPWEEITHHFPTAKQITILKEPITEILGPLGIIKSRSNSIFALANSIANGEIRLESGVNPEIEKEKLLSLKGIGPWTAEYLTMRGISWPDAFPVTDIGVKHALTPLLVDENGDKIMDNKEGSTKYVLNKRYEKYALQYAEAFRPWRSYLTIALWASLSSNEVKE